MPKFRGGKSPTQRTLALLRKLGYTAAVVERWNPHARIRQDLFGIGDILAIREGETLLVQATSTRVKDRIEKSKSSPHLRTWLKAGNLFEVWGWRKLKKTGQWEPRRVKLELAGKR